MMNRVLTATAVLICTATIASAQGQDQGRPAGPPPRGEGQHRPGFGKGPLFEGITLTDAQKAQVKAIKEKYKSQNEETRKAAHEAMKKAREAGDREAMRAAAAKMGPNEEMGKEIAAVLTPEQKDRYNKNKEAMKERTKGKGGFGGMRGGRGRDRSQDKPQGNAHSL